MYKFVCGVVSCFCTMMMLLFDVRLMYDTSACMHFDIVVDICIHVVYVLSTLSITIYVSLFNMLVPHVNQLVIVHMDNHLIIHHQHHNHRIKDVVRSCRTQHNTDKQNKNKNKTTQKQKNKNVNTTSHETQQPTTQKQQQQHENISTSPCTST